MTIEPGVCVVQESTEYTLGNSALELYPYVSQGEKDIQREKA